MGGEDVFVGKLDFLFMVFFQLEGEVIFVDIIGLIGQYVYGNEFSYYIIYMYNYVNCLWCIQELVDSVLYNQYFNVFDGLLGNEDCGQMFVWYILNFMGFYQVCFGKLVYFIGCLLFEEVMINLFDCKIFVICIYNNLKINKYIELVLLNGKLLDVFFFIYDDLVCGGMMEIIMSFVLMEWGKQVKN